MAVAAETIYNNKIPATELIQIPFNSDENENENENENNKNNKKDNLGFSFATNNNASSNSSELNNTQTDFLTSFDRTRTFIIRVSGIDQLDGKTLSTFYNELGAYRASLRKQNVSEGGTGIGYVYKNENEQPTYYIKSISAERTYRQPPRAGSKDLINAKKNAIDMINDIIVEINTTIDITVKKPEIISNCIGAYVSYRITNSVVSYRIYLVFTYLPGMDLQSWIRKYKNARYNDIYRQNAEIIARSLNRCVEQLHSIGYVHRDLKPKNIYVVLHGDQVECCILIDFGETLKIGKEDPLKYFDEEDSNNARYNPLSMDNTTYKFRKTYNGKVKREQNLISLNRIITFDTRDKLGLGLSRNILNNSTRGVLETLQSKKGGNRCTKKNNRRKNRTRRSS
jgi:hypothetical protein